MIILNKRKITGPNKRVWVLMDRGTRLSAGAGKGWGVGGCVTVHMHGQEPAIGKGSWAPHRAAPSTWHLRGGWWSWLGAQAGAAHAGLGLGPMAGRPWVPWGQAWVGAGAPWGGMWAGSRHSPWVLTAPPPLSQEPPPSMAEKPQIQLFVKVRGFRGTWSAPGWWAPLAGPQALLGWLGCAASAHSSIHVVPWTAAGSSGLFPRTQRNAACGQRGLCCSAWGSGLG